MNKNIIILLGSAYLLVCTTSLLQCGETLSEKTGIRETYEKLLPAVPTLETLAFLKISIARPTDLKASDVTQLRDAIDHFDLLADGSDQLDCSEQLNNIRELRNELWHYQRNEALVLVARKRIWFLKYFKSWLSHTHFGGDSNQKMAQRKYERIINNEERWKAYEPSSMYLPRTAAAETDVRSASDNTAMKWLSFSRDDLPMDQFYGGF